MDSREKKSFAKAMSYKNNAQAGKMPLPATPESKKPDRKETRESKEFSSLRQENLAKYLEKVVPAEKVLPAEKVVSAEKLQEAIIWSEILGKPVSKRRKRR